MRITFLGTGTSQGVPMIGCACAVCQSSASEDKRFRASIVVTHDDGTQVLVDTTPDLRSQALASQLTRVDAVVYTHSHADHIFGLDELRRFISLRGGGTLTVHGDTHTIAELRRIFAYAFSAPPELGGMELRIHCRGNLIYRAKVIPGDVEIRFPLPPSLQPFQSLTLELEASKTVRPPNDGRSLSLVFEQISIR